MSAFREPGLRDSYEDELDRVVGGVDGVGEPGDSVPMPIRPWMWWLLYFALMLLPQAWLVQAAEWVGR